MAFEILSGPYLNHLTRTATAPAMNPSALALFPSTNLHDNRSSKPAIFASATSDSTITADLTIIRGGSFESSSDATFWTMLGVGTISTITSTSYEGAGAGALYTDGSANEAIAYQDVTARSGETLNFFAAVESTSTSGAAYVQIRNRETGRWLRGSDQTWTSSESYVLEVTSSTWETTAVTFAVESLATCIRDSVQLRVYLHNTTSEGRYDQVSLWPSINWLSIHGHNIPPFISPIIEYSTDLAATWTTYAAMTLRRDSFYHLFAALETQRHWRLRLAGVPDVGSLMYMGEVVAGQSFDLLHNPVYGGTLKWVDLQTRLDSDIGESFVGLHNVAPQRTMQLNFTFPSSTEYEQFHKQIFRGSRGGGNLMCVAPIEMDDSVVILGRVHDQIEVAKHTPLERTSILEIVESPLPNAPEVAYAYDAPITGGG